MDIEPPATKQPPPYSKTWNDFIERAMPVLVDNPTSSRYTIKFVPKKNEFVLKVTDGLRIVMKKCHAFEEYEEIEKFTHLAARALTNEAEAEKIDPELEKANKEAKKKKKKK